MTVRGEDAGEEAKRPNPVTAMASRKVVGADTSYGQR